MTALPQWVVRDLRHQELEHRLRAAADALPSHGFHQATSGDYCLSCGLAELHPIHDLREVDEHTAQEATPSPNPVDPAQTSAEQPEYSGMMIALFPDPDQAKRLSVKGGARASDLHVTLAYFPDASETDFDELGKLLAEVAPTMPELSGEVSGVGIFSSAHSDGRVTYASIDLPGLPAFRQRLVELCSAAGFEISGAHGYSPHMTLAMGDNRDIDPANEQLHFDEIVLAAGKKRVPFKLGVKETAAEGDPAKAKKIGKHAYSHPRFVHGSGVDDDKTPPCLVCGESPSHDNHHSPLPGEAIKAMVTARDACKLVAGVDAGVDQALVLLRSTPDLPEYAAQARDLLQAIEPACDDLLEFFRVDDADDPTQELPEIPTQSAATAVSTTEQILVRPRVQTEEIIQSEVALTGERAFISELNGRTLLTAPASTLVQMWEKAATPNKHILWMQGRFVGAEKANRNNAMWTTGDLEMGAPTVAHGPLNWLHEAKHVIGCIADSKLTMPSDKEIADHGGQPYISALSAIWKWVYPDEAWVVENASDQNRLWYSMECVSELVECTGLGGCGEKASYGDYMSGKGCLHMRQRSATRRFEDPTFLGGAVIVPPVRPGWADAQAQVMREAASFAEKAYEQAGQPDIPASEWEQMMAGVVLFSQD